MSKEKLKKEIREELNRFAEHVLYQYDRGHEVEETYLDRVVDHTIDHVKEEERKRIEKGVYKIAQLGNSKRIISGLYSDARYRGTNEEKIEPINRLDVYKVVWEMENMYDLDENYSNDNFYNQIRRRNK